MLGRSGEGDGSNIGGSLELIIRSVAAGPWHTKQKSRPELIRAAHRYCCLSRNDMSAKKVMA
jgi:hypothetical protein